MLKAADAAFLLALAIGGFAGLRSSEIERLDWSEVRLADRFIEIKNGKAKTASRRLVPIADNLAEWLTAFANPSGRTGTGSHDAFYDAQQATAPATAAENARP